MKKVLFFLLCTPVILKAQDKILLAEGTSPGLYLTHKVAAKENYYSVGRIYNISPREIAPFNNLQLESGLSLGQTIKIPLSASNFFQSGTAAADETFVPVYHIVKDKEGLYRVALNHNDLPLENLKQWNKIKGDAVKNGTKLIIGYLKVKKEQSSLAKNGIGNSIETKTVAVVKTEKKPSVTDSTNKIKTATEAGPPSINPDRFPTVKNPDNEKKVVAEEVKKEPAAKVKETENRTEKVTVADGKNIKGGAFKALYELQVYGTDVTNGEGLFGVFKSTSGWKDGKYYCLFNNAPPGTVIKVSNPLNGKFVYAKVLDLIPDIKQNNGVLILISNAAADELSPAENNFNCSISYSK